MEKKEIWSYIYIWALIISIVFLMYIFNLKFTGFTVFTQNNQADFDEGIYDNVFYDTNLSAIILYPNQTNGTYTSKIFDSGNASSIWNNLIWQGEGINFEVRNCSDINCTNTNFSSADLQNLNLTGQYFQYRALFDSLNDSLQSVTLNYTIYTNYSNQTSVPNQTFVPVTVDLLQPSGTKRSSPIPIEFLVTGTNLTCWYNLKNRDDGTIIIPNTTLQGCNNSTFSVNQNKRYLFSIYVNNSTGFIAVDTSEFIYNASNLSEEKEQSLNNSDNESIQSLNQSIIEENLEEQQSPTIQISLMENLSQEIIQGSFKEFTISVQNTGDTPVSSCRLRVEDPEWINLSNEAKDLAPGESNSFKFLVSVPNKAPIGEKTFKLFVECTEISESKQFIVNVLEKKLDLIVNDVQRVTPTRVRIIYTLKELSGESQFVQLKFSLFSSDNKEISNTTQNKSINPNEEKEFVASMRINKSINGTLNLVTFYNSQIFSSSLSEPINLGTPIGGFVILGERFGASKFVIIPIIIVVFAATFFILKKIRKLHNIKKQKTK